MTRLEMTLAATSAVLAVALATVSGLHWTELEPIEQCEERFVRTFGDPKDPVARAVCAANLASRKAGEQRNRETSPAPPPPQTRRSRAKGSDSAEVSG